MDAIARITGTVPGPILIADDDNVARTLLRRLLDGDGHDVRDASNGLTRVSTALMWIVGGNGLQ